MQSIIASCVYKNKSFDYINASFIYTIKACIYSFLMSKRLRDSILSAFFHSYIFAMYKNEALWI